MKHFMCQHAVRGMLTICVFAGGSIPASAQTQLRFRSKTEHILVNVVVRDRTGAFVSGLTKDDFVITEDSRPQSVTTFDSELIGASVVTDVPTSAALSMRRASGPVSLQSGHSESPPTTTSAYGHRIIVIVFDLSSLRSEELDRAIKTSLNYVDTRLSSVDLIAVATMSPSLRMLHDLSGDRE